ncbi:MAG: glucan endo-1,6-beta-glucosidase [Dysgonamonadaceae bacterium]|jgi:glucosylceramidase|nr:glucan endo-1,6-beta-glucosidase [Dysgonamonadaceae bacterium]
MKTIKKKQIGFAVAAIALASFVSCLNFNDYSGFDDEQTTIEGDVHFWQTSRNEYYLFSEAAVNYSNDLGDFTIRLNPETEYQTMEGFGAALTGSSAFLIRTMAADKRQTLLNDLFSREKGAGINFLRITIGSSDFSLGLYTYCDTEGIDHFAIPETDRRDLIPVLKEILAINPEIKIMASPWSPPAWMKTSRSMIGGSLKPEYYNDFGDYFVKYVQAMKAEGVTIDALTLQNEPLFESTEHPSMRMEWREQSEIIRDYVGPKFKAAALTTKILILDHNFDLYEYPLNILNDPDTRQYVAGTAFHGYEGSPSAIQEVTKMHPDKGIYFTELSGGGWNDNLATDRMETMLHYLTDYAIPSIQYGCKNFIMWNLALNPQDGPTTPGGTFCKDCRGVVTINDDGSYRKELEYYLIAHFSKVVRVGAKRIHTTFTGTHPDNLFITAFVNPDGSKALIVANRSGNKSTFTVRNGSQRFTYTAANDAVISFLIQ